MHNIIPLVQQFFFLKYVISSAFVVASSLNEASFNFDSSFSWTYRTNSLPFTKTFLPVSISPIHSNFLLELDSYNTIPIKLAMQQSKIQNKTLNRHLLTFQCGHFQNLLPGWFTLGDEDDDDDPPFPFILSPIIPRASLRVQNSQGLP